MTPKKKPEAPAHLKPDTAAWWRSVVAEYLLEPHHTRLLTLASEAWDRGQQSREILAEKGLTFVDRFDQPRARPEVSIERDSRTAFARLVRELGLDLSDPEPSKPSTIAGGKGKIRHA